MPNEQCRVAILGGTGFAGRSVRDELEKAGMEVGIFSRSSGCDLLDLANTWSKLDQFRPEFIVNCAALVGSVNYVSDFAADVIDVNMRMLLNTYKVAQQLRDVIVINPIANCAFPGVMNEYREECLWDGPIHPSVLSYGSTRRMMDALARCYHAQYGVRSSNLIVPNMYGPYDSTNFNKAHALNALVIKFVTAVKYGHSAVEVWGTGQPIREWLYVRDFARVVRNVVESQHMFLEPISIAQNHGLTVTELVEIISDASGFEGEIVYNTKYPDGSPKKVMNDIAFRRTFPDFEFTSFDTGLRETLEYYNRIL
jgi:GDP-L-fucose synthase